MSKKEILKEIFNNIVKSADAANSAEVAYVGSLKQEQTEKDEEMEKEC